MINSDLVSFLDNSDTITSFERKKKIRELTDKLDIHLLDDLRREIIYYYECKFVENAQKRLDYYDKSIREIIIKNGDNLDEFIKEPGNELYRMPEYSRRDFRSDVSIHNLTISDFIKTYSDRGRTYSLMEDVFDKTSEFVYDLEELILLGNKLFESTENEETASLGKVADVNEKMAHLEELILRGNNILERAENVGSRDSDIADAKEKMIYLEKLGIIDYLIKELPAKTSKTKIAELLAIIIGETKGNIQSYLSAIIRKDTTNKNPLSNADDVNFIVNKLFRDYRYTPEQK